MKKKEKLKGGSSRTISTLSFNSKIKIKVTSIYTNVDKYSQGNETTTTLCDIGDMSNDVHGNQIIADVMEDRDGLQPGVSPCDEWLA